jgi:hypothetical protein
MGGVIGGGAGVARGMRGGVPWSVTATAPEMPCDLGTRRSVRKSSSLMTSSSPGNRDSKFGPSVRKDRDSSNTGSSIGTDLRWQGAQFEGRLRTFDDDEGEGGAVEQRLRAQRGELTRDRGQLRDRRELGEQTLPRGIRGWGPVGGEERP